MKKVINKIKQNWIKEIYILFLIYKKVSESSVIIPSTRPMDSKKAHYASASAGASTQGIPNIERRYFTY